MGRSAILVILGVFVLMGFSLGRPSDEIKKSDSQTTLASSSSENEDVVEHKPKHPPEEENTPSKRLLLSSTKDTSFKKETSSTKINSTGTTNARGTTKGPGATITTGTIATNTAGKANTNTTGTVATNTTSTANTTGKGGTVNTNTSGTTNTTGKANSNATIPLNAEEEEDLSETEAESESLSQNTTKLTDREINTTATPGEDDITTTTTITSVDQISTKAANDNVEEKAKPTMETAIQLAPGDDPPSPFYIPLLSNDVEEEGTEVALGGKGKTFYELTEVNRGKYVGYGIKSVADYIWGGIPGIGENEELPKEISLSNDCPFDKDFKFLLCGSDGNTYENLSHFFCAQMINKDLLRAWDGPCNRTEFISIKLDKDANKMAVINPQEIIKYTA